MPNDHAHAVADSIRDAIAAYEADVAVLRQALEVLERRGSTRTSPTPPTRSKQGSRNQMIVDLLNADPSRHWTAPEIHDALVEQGWQSEARNPMNGVRTSLARLASPDRNQIRRVRDGVYRGVAPSFANGPASSNGSAEEVVPEFA